MDEVYSLYAVSPEGNVLLDEETVPGCEKLATPEDAKHMALILVALGTHTIRIESEFGFVTGTAFEPRRHVLMTDAAFN